jgi:uncharacterized SAM-binding protein YcdF (DUF218 family)
VRIKTLLIILGLLIFLMTIVGLFVGSFNFGFVIIFGISCGLVLYGLFFEKLSKIKWLTYGIFTLFTFFSVLALFLAYYGRTDNVTFSENAVVVLGAGIRGEHVTRHLSYRLDKAAEYSVKNPTAVIIVSGGRGPGENITEALAMERYLVSKGVSKDRIIKEEESTSTYENLLYSKKILDRFLNNPYIVVIITNSFHIFRATKTAEKLGLNVTHYHAKIEWYSVPLNYSRECMALILNFGRILLFRI